jgi:hypothetical protein
LARLRLQAQRWVPSLRSATALHQRLRGQVCRALQEDSYQRSLQPASVTGIFAMGFYFALIGVTGIFETMKAQTAQLIWTGRIQ